MVLQSAALHGWVLEVADAKSAFLQAGQTGKGRQLYTYGEPELRAALKVTEAAKVPERGGAIIGLAPPEIGHEHLENADNEVGQVQASPRRGLMARPWGCTPRLLADICRNFIFW